MKVGWDFSQLSNEELLTWADSWAETKLSTEIVSCLWDKPSIETRDEFRTALLHFHAPLFEIAVRLAAALERERLDVVALTRILVHAEYPTLVGPGTYAKQRLEFIEEYARERLEARQAVK